MLFLKSPWVKVRFLITLIFKVFKFVNFMIFLINKKKKIKKILKKSVNENIKSNS